MDPDNPDLADIYIYIYNRWWEGAGHLQVARGQYTHTLELGGGLPESSSARMCGSNVWSNGPNHNS